MAFLAVRIGDFEASCSISPGSHRFGTTEGLEQWALALTSEEPPLILASSDFRSLATVLNRLIEMYETRHMTTRKE